MSAGHNGAAGGGYWNPAPREAGQDGFVELDAGPLGKLRLRTGGHTFSRRRIDPGTALLVRALLDQYPPSASGPSPARIADLGAGYGPLGLALAYRFPQAQVELIEVNARAAALARENAARHGRDRVVVLEGDVGTVWQGRPAYDLIVTNPPIRAGRAVYAPWLTEADRHLRAGGAFFLVCRTAQGATTLAELLARALVQVEVVARKGGYKVIRALRPPGFEAPAGRQPAP